MSSLTTISFLILKEQQWAADAAGGAMIDIYDNKNVGRSSNADSNLVVQGDAVRFLSLEVVNSGRRHLGEL